MESGFIYLFVYFFGDLGVFYNLIECNSWIFQYSKHPFFFQMITFNHLHRNIQLREGPRISYQGKAGYISPSYTEDDDDDSDVNLFGEDKEEEKKAAEERAAAVKASGKKKESGKSSILLDVNPWDDETDMAKLEETVRSVQMEGLSWGMSKLVAVGYGIKKLQIMMTIVDDKSSIGSIIGFWLSGL
ncbi:hypothetical protein MKW92_010065 [Papaver armeniacum]|nr:hypothetical protein MKW92_010065 [Papaver armeniacum]